MNTFNLFKEIIKLKKENQLIENNQSFCMAPWTHLNVSPSGDVPVCCNIINSPETVLGNVNNDTLDEIWNSSNMKNIRRKMLKGEKIKECSSCYYREEIDKKGSMRYALNDRYFNKHQELVKKTKDDGFVDDLNIVYIDFRFSNKCNFSCRTCVPYYSSSWEKKLNISLPKINNISKLLEKTKDMISQNKLEEIYFAGGETLITSEHWEIIDFLIENNNDCKNVIQLAIETARQINQSQTGSEAMTELGLFCLNHLRLNDFEQIIGFELIKNQRDRLIAAYAQHQFSTLTDDQLLDYLKSLQTIVIRNEFIAKLIIHSLKTNRKDLFHTCLNQITSRKERIQIFSSLVLNLREDNSILIPIDFDIFIPEIMVAIVQQFNLDIIDIEQKLYYLRNMIQDEVAHFQLFHQILIKEYFLERKEAGVLVNELPNEIFDFQWAIDIKNQLPN